MAPVLGYGGAAAGAGGGGAALPACSVSPTPRGGPFGSRAAVHAGRHVEAAVTGIGGAVRGGDGKPGVALHGDVEGIAGMADRSGLARNEAVARRGEGDAAAAAGRSEDRIELHLLGTEARGAGVGDVVGDAGEPPLERDLAG